jgi:RNA polymerase sigma factor (sigma-70 family)
MRFSHQLSPTLLAALSASHAFQHPSSTKYHTKIFTTSPIPTTSQSILNDANGHLNSNLASAIYEWEKVHAQESTLANQDFSTRDGLRLVDLLAREILSSISSDDVSSREPVSYSDLVQEGMMALLRAMSSYTRYQSHTSKDEGFESYAKKSVQSALLNFLAHSSRPISLPLSLQTTLQKANAAAAKLRTRLGKEPSLIQVAKEVDVSPEKLALYRKLHRTIVGRLETFVSMEDGIEIYDPTLAGSLAAAKFTEDESDDEDDDLTEQDLFTLNIKEDNWETKPPERSVMPLRDLITDTEEINNPSLYTHHKRLTNELDQFLLETLDAKEREVIQLRFGLVESKFGGRGWSAGQISERMGIGKDEVVKIASGALEKLRNAAATDDPFIEVSL